MNDVIHVGEVSLTDSKTVLKPFIPTVILDHSRVTSNMSMQPQTVSITLDGLETYLKPIVDQLKQGPIDLTFVRSVAAYTTEILHADVNKWNEIVTREDDIHYSLERCIQEQINTCFHRAIFFQLLMQKAEIQSQIVEGRWIETNRTNLKEISEKDEVFSVLGDGTRICMNEKTDEHLWNRVIIGGKHYLVDTAYLVNGSPVIQEIEFGKEGHPYIILPDGIKRYYVSDIISSLSCAPMSKVDN